MEKFLLPEHGRRTFLKNMSLLAAGYLLSTTGACEDFFEKIKNRPLRRRIRSGSAEVDAVMNTYRSAITYMKNTYPAADGRHYTKQSDIHGTSAGFNHCQHGTDHFLSWHRAYLFYFEKICQTASGDPQFALPYWNWALNPDVPAPYVDTSSVLFSSRVRTSMSGFSAVEPATMDTIMGYTNFFVFSSNLEGTPHNSVHSRIGGTLGQFYSPMDPLFWQHHCMIDYCWYDWNVNRENDNPNDPAWTGETWNHFTDANGNTATISALATLLMPFLSYRYEDSQIGTTSRFLALQTKKEFMKVRDRIEKGADVRFDIRRTIPVAEGASMALNQSFSAEPRVKASELAQIVEKADTDERLFLQIGFARLPSTNDFFVRVFVNAPQANASTPRDDSHYAGSFAFFGTDTGEHGGDHGGGHKAHKPRFLVDVTDAIRTLRRQGDIKDDQALSFQLVAVPMSEALEQPQAVLNLEKIDLIVSPVKIKAVK